MSDIAIKVEGIGKKYRIGKKKSGELRESFSNFLNYLKPITNHQQQTTNEFWALKDISFEVKQGEAVGIIGRNGAGKSTLLKVLSRITKPTTGRLEINGRVSSLLEVGTGFHPELTGRENIFLNGTILGMRRAEIKAKFDEIIYFSGVEEFIDTPVKHYSSGMKVRLAFAVAAHLEPEILIIDEVLAVGDAEFQKKCLGKMEDVTGQGRTVLFVSHNMGAISKLCRNGILLNNGLIADQGEINMVIKNYLSENKSVHKTEGITIVVDYSSKSHKWTKNSDLILRTSVDKRFLKRNRFFFEMAAYNPKGVKVFSYAENLSKILSKDQNTFYIKITNVGFSEVPLSFDFGLREEKEKKYHVLLTDFIQVIPQDSNKVLKVFDVVTVPPIKIEK